MSLIGMTPTLSTIRTLTAPIEVASSTNITVASGLTLTARNSTTTYPVTVTSGVTNGIVVGASLNYAKIQCFIDNSASGTATIHCLGWNRDRLGIWRPQTLATVSASVPATTGTSINDETLFAYGTYALALANQGNIKQFNSPHTGVFGGWFLLDVCGCELLEIRFNHGAGGSRKFNALVGFI